MIQIMQVKKNFNFEIYLKFSGQKYKKDLKVLVQHLSTLINHKTIALCTMNSLNAQNN